jgi:radical SAM protein with 4Fe4S-binding SPASM domain
MNLIFAKNKIIHRFSSFVRPLLYFATGFRCDSPTEVVVELTNRCNLRCTMCWFHGQSGIGDKYSGQELTTAEICGIVDQLSKCKPRLYLGGAEPFIRKDFLMILKRIKSQNLAVSFTTNGTLIDSTAIETIVTLGVDAVNFSIDGPQALHDRVRGEGVFKKVTCAIKALSQYKKSNAVAKPVINVNVTIASDIIGQIEQTIRAVNEATQNGVDFYRLHHLWYITSTELQRHQQVLKQILNCSAPGAASHVIAISEISDVFAVAKEISLLANQSGIRMFPNLPYFDVIDYYSDAIIDGRRCLSPFFRALIKPNGDVKFCPDEWIDDYILGNIREDSFDNIWNNRKARKFRAELWRRRCFPGCKRCNGRFSF